MKLIRRFYLIVSVGCFLSVIAVAGTKPITRVQNPIKGSYIVVLQDDVGDPAGAAADLARKHGAFVGRAVDGGIKAFELLVRSQQGEKIAEAVAADPRVNFIEEVSRIELSAVQDIMFSPTLWGLDHIDESEITTDFEYYPNLYEDGTYEYTSDGYGVRIYVVDTGVRADHSEFTQTGWSRVISGQKFTPGDDPWPANDPCGMISGGSGSGCGTTSTPGCGNCGHGTAVASIAAGATYGVAKRAIIVPVKVLDGAATGDSVQLLQGLNWIYQQNPQGGVINISMFYRINPPGISCRVWVANDGGQATAINQLISQLITDRSMVVAVSANNHNRDARCTVPANNPDVLTVGGAARNDTRFDISENFGSNFGEIVDLFAPAEGIGSASIESRWAERLTGTTGTSFAAPFVAGCAARYRQSVPSASGTLTRAAILSYALYGIMNGDLMGSGDFYLYCPWYW